RRRVSGRYPEHALPEECRVQGRAWQAYRPPEFPRGDDPDPVLREGGPPHLSRRRLEGRVGLRGQAVLLRNVRLCEAGLGGGQRSPQTGRDRLLVVEPDELGRCLESILVAHEARDDVEVEVEDLLFSDLVIVLTKRDTVGPQTPAWRLAPPVGSV